MSAGCDSRVRVFATRDGLEPGAGVRRAGSCPSPGRHVGVVLASGGYPDGFETGMSISGLDEAAAVPGTLVFHAGTAERGRGIVTAGGRLLTVVGSGPGFAEARERAYDAVAKIGFDGMHYRRDIGVRAL